MDSLRIGKPCVYQVLKLAVQCSTEWKLAIPGRLPTESVKQALEGARIDAMDAGAAIRIIAELCCCGPKKERVCEVLVVDEGFVI